MARYLFSGLLILTVQIGCALHKGGTQQLSTSALPAAEAPRFQLTTDGKPAISTVSHRIEPDVQIVDGREFVQKMYYPGETDPHRWHDAVSVIPMEAFQPDIDQRLERAVIDSLQDPLAYASIEVNVLSCFATLDKRSAAEGQLLYEFEQWNSEQASREKRRDEQGRKQATDERESRQFRRSIGIPAVDGDHDEELGSAVGQLFFDTVFVTPVRALNRRRQRSKQLKVLPQTLPPEFTAESVEGWNCCVKLEVKYVGSDEKRRTVSVLAQKHLEDAPSASAADQCQTVVLSALDEVEEQLRQAWMNVSEL